MKGVLALVLLIACAAQSEVEWKQTEATLQVHPTQMMAEAAFDFTNTGDKPVSFPSMQITCGCLSAKPLKQSYAPGETGRLVVVYNLENRVGPQRKHVIVDADDGQRTDLVIAVDIPESYVAKPTLLVWKKDDKADKKTIGLSNSNAVPIKLLSVASSHEGLPAELKTVREGFEYEVVVARGTSEGNIRSVIRIATEPPPGETESKTLKLYVFAQ